MNEDIERLLKLHDRANDLYWDVGPEAALPYAEQLAELLDPNEDSGFTRECWIVIWMARGRLDKAVEIGEQDLEHLIAELHETFPPPLDLHDKAEIHYEVDGVLTGYFLQAGRYLKMDLVDAAKAKMEEAFNLSQEFSVPFDEDLQHLYDILFNGAGSIEDYFDDGSESVFS